MNVNLYGGRILRGQYDTDWLVIPDRNIRVRVIPENLSQESVDALIAIQEKMDALAASESER